MYSSGKYTKSIKTKIVLRVTALIAVILTLAIAFIVYLSITDLQEKASLDLKNRSQNLAHDVEIRLEYLQESTELLAHNELLINAFIDEKERDRYLLPLINNFKKGKYLGSFSLVDFDGRVIFQTDRNTPTFKQSNELRLSLSLSQTIAYFNMSESEVVFIVPIKYYATSQGAIVATYNMKKIIEEYNQNEDFIYTKFFKNSLEYYSEDYDNSKSYYKYKLLDNKSHELLHTLEMTIEMGMLESVYIEPLKKQIVPLTLFGVLILAIGIWISYYLATTIINPILALYNRVNKEVSQDINGEYEPLGSGDELEILGYAFYKKEKELEEFNESLNIKVEEATKELIEQRNFNRSLVESANSIIAVIDKNGVMIDINPFGEFFTGYTKEEIASKPFFWARFLPLDIQGKVLHIIESAKKGEIVKQFQNSWIAKSGETRVFEWSNALIKDESGNLKYITTIGVDITDMMNYQKELIIAKEEAEKANKSKSEFLANMSHEIRTPLNGVLGLTDLVLKTNLDAQQRDYLEKAKTSSKALLHVINDVLDYSKIEAGRLDLEHKAFELDSVMSNIKDLFEYQANKKGLSLNISGNNKLTLIGDALRLTQILTNIVGNAIKFTEKGSIDIKVESILENEHHKKLKFSIKDSGIGMNKKVQENLFKEFTQADSSITRKYGGTGLGLSISKHLVQMMSGEIWVESKEGEGSTFIFSAAFEKSNKEDKLIVKPQMSKSNIDSIQGARILLVEDNKINQTVAIGMLENLNLHVEVANNGREAVEMIEEGREYDIILMDLQMPIMDGFEASKLIKQINKNIPIVALSAAVMQEDLVKTSEAEMSAHLAKPINEDELVRTLLQFIKPKKYNEESLNEKIKELSSDDAQIEFYGVDLEELKHRIGDKPKIVKKILLNFCEEYADAQLIFDISKIETDEFYRAMHSLKGISGNISLKEIYKLSKEIYETQDLQIKKELTQKLIELLKETVKNLKVQLDVADGKVSDKEYNKEEVLKYLQEIQGDIKHFRAVNMDRVAQLEEMLSRHVQIKIIKELSSYLRGYKYKEADKIVSDIYKLLVD
ncbi:MAG: ATP-binding protein [Sulfurimonas sp.]|jgi:PAS domain S-box-containing protein